MTDFTTRFDRAPAAYDPSIDSYDRRMDAARSALASGDRAAAGQALEAAIAMAERTPDGASALAVALSRLGEIRHLDGQDGEAVQLFRRALEINEGLLGQEHPDLVVLLNDLSRLYLKRGSYSEAEPLLLRLHAIKRTKGEDHPETATVLASLASVKQALGRYDAAEQLWRRVLEIRERTLAPHHFSIATALEHLGETCAARGKLNEALRHRLRALAMREMTLDPGHPSLRTARERIADLQLQASEEVLDVDAPDVAQPPVWLLPTTSAPAVPDRTRATPAAPQPDAPAAVTRVAEPDLLPQPAIPPRAQAAAVAPRHPAYTPPPPARTPPAQQVAEPMPLRHSAPPAFFADDDLLDDDPDRRDAPEAGGLQLVNVAGVGDGSRSVIMPYYADVLALAEETANTDDLGGRPAAGFVSSTVSFLRSRQAAIVGSVGAGILILGALGAQSFARSPGGAGATDARDFRPTPATAPVPETSVAVADSVTAAGSPDPALTAGDRDAGRITERSRVPDEATRPVRSARPPVPASPAADSPSPPSSGPVPRALNVSVDPVPQASAAGVTETLAAKVTLPTGARLRSVASAGENESQPALLIVAPTPVYPVSLYTSSVAGAAAVEFVVDTSGRVDMSTFKSQANHELFTEAVRHIMPDMRFVPSTRNGRKVRTQMRMRFEFNKSGVSSSRPN